MLSIRQLFYTLSALYIVLLFSGLLLTRWFWFYPMELSHYTTQQQNELSSLATALTIRQEQLQANVDDYGHWNDTWNFVYKPNRAFLNDNFTTSSMATLNLDAVVITDTEWNLRLAHRLNHTDGELVNAAEFYDWAVQHPDRDDVFGAESTQDIVRIAGAPYLLAISPVLRSDHSGPQAGWLLFFQRIDVEFLNSLSRITRISLRKIAIPGPDEAAIMPLELPITEASPVHQRCIYSSRQEPALCFELLHSSLKKPDFISTGTLLVLLILTIIPVALFAALMQLITEPIRKATSLIQRNNFDGLLRPVLFSTPLRVKELRQLRDAFNELVYTARQQQTRLEQLSNTDRLTGIANRRAFDEVLDNTWRRINRHQQQIALVLADIDYFKAYNDHYGHQRGDNALLQVAQALKGCARRTDEIAARFGGEEFVIILYADSAEDMNNIRARLSRCIQELNIPHEDSRVSDILTVSFGIAWIQNSGDWLENYTAEDWLRAADAALYAAKGAGRDRSMLQIITPETPFTTSPEYR